MGVQTTNFGGGIFRILVWVWGCWETNGVRGGMVEGTWWESWRNWKGGVFVKASFLSKLKLAIRIHIKIIYNINHHIGHICASYAFCAFSCAFFLICSYSHFAPLPMGSLTLASSTFFLYNSLILSVRNPSSCTVLVPFSRNHIQFVHSSFFRLLIWGLALSLFPWIIHFSSFFQNSFFVLA